MHEAVLLGRAGDVDADRRVVATDRLEEVELGLDVDPHRRGRLVERGLDERLRGKVEDAVRAQGRDELLDRAGVGELAVEERDAALPGLVGLAGARGVAAFDDVEDPAGGELLEVFHARAPAVGPVDRDLGVLGEDVFGEVAAREARDPGDQHPHRAQA